MSHLQDTGHHSQPIREELVRACCELEAEAFNRLRAAWGEPAQHPRRADWLSYQARHYPDNTVALLDNDRVIGFNMVHQWGSLGWVGPAVVSPDYQGRGLGGALMRWSLERLQALGCTTIGLETWPHNLGNVSLYVKVGFDVGPLTCVLEKPTAGSAAHFTGRRLLDLPERSTLMQGLAALWDQIMPGLDYGPLVENLLACKMGDVFFWGDERLPDAAAIVRFESYAEGPAPPFANIEVLTARPGSESTLDAWLAEIAGAAVTEGKSALRVSLSSSHAEGLRHLITGPGYRLVKTRLRMYAALRPVPPGLIDYLSYSV